MLALVHAHALQKGYAFTVVREAEAFEYAVLEYPFAFWQYGSGDCGPIPGAAPRTRSCSTTWSPFPRSLFTPMPTTAYYRPLFYQAYTEIGYCPYVFEHLGDLLQAVPAPSYRAFAPRGVELTFRPEVMQAVVPWLRNQGARIVYIYGGNDPWTAAALDPAPGLDALQVVQPGANHRREDQGPRPEGAVIAALERWLEIDIDESQAGQRCG